MSSGRTYPIEPPPVPQSGAATVDAATAARQLRDSRRWCRRLAKSHYENFLVASILLPRRMVQPFYSIYAFCRTADDAADESPSSAVALQRLEQLNDGLERVFRGHAPPHTFFPALAETIATYELPRQPFDDLLSAFRQDQIVHEYATTFELLDYCQRSANPVGHLILGLANACDEENAALADEICTGLQLANFWQDVARDRDIGRVYLPVDLRHQFGVSEEMLDEQETLPPLRRLLAHLCDQAEGHFHRGLPLCQRVPRWLAADVKLFAHGGLATLDAIRNIDYDVLRVRPAVGRGKQLALVLRTLVGKL